MNKIESDDYKRGWYDGYQAAQKDSTRIIPTQPITRTEDLMWPDRLPTTSPFPPTVLNRCNTCGIEMKGAWSYVCNHPNCPIRVGYSTSTSGEIK